MRRGPLPGPRRTRKGKFDQANGGTLFLDEIGDMSLKSQAKVLRILQEQKFERVGGSRTIEVDVRVLAATNKDLEEEIDGGHFPGRPASTGSMWCPSVVPDLGGAASRISRCWCQDFIKQFSRKRDGQEAHFPPRRCPCAPTQHSWPGNVRELRNLVERLMIMIPGDMISDRGCQPVPRHAKNGLASPATLAGQYQHLGYQGGKALFRA